MRRLKKLCKLLSERIGGLTIEATCADQGARNFSSAADLLKYENPKDKRIVSLHLRASDYSERIKSASVVFWRTWLRGVAIEVEAEEDVASRLRSDLLEILAASRPWYNLVTRLNFVAIGLTGFTITWATILVWIAIKIRGKTPAQHPDSFWTFTMFLNVFSLMAVGWGVYRFRDMVFPPAVFLRTGQEAIFRPREISMGGSHRFSRVGHCRDRHDRFHSIF